jgi:hypothetical protein
VRCVKTADRLDERRWIAGTIATAKVSNLGISIRALGNPGTFVELRKGVSALLELSL